MGIENYELTPQQAKDIPPFYYPGHEDYVSVLEFESRDDERQNPTIQYSIKDIPNSSVKLTLYPTKPEVEWVDLMGNDEDMPIIRSTIEGILGIKLSESKDCLGVQRD